MAIRRTSTLKIVKKTKTIKKYTIDGLTYDSLKLYNYHAELKKCQKAGLIQSFSLIHMDNENQKSKYHAKKVLINGIQFDSIMESRFYLLLQAFKRTGKIINFEMQKKFVLIPSFKKNGKTIREIAYIADFVVYGNDGKVDVIDIKGLETPEFKLKYKMFERFYPDLTLICYQYSASKKIWETLDEIKIRRKQNKKLKKAKAIEN